jgi:hypothetical protein
MTVVDPPLPEFAGTLTRLGERTWTATAPGGTVELRLPAGPVFVRDGDHVLPGDGKGHGRCWVLPADPFSADPAWSITADAALAVEHDAEGCRVTVDAATATLTAHRARPHADVDGGSFAFEFPGSELLADALAGFYWGTMLPCVVERTTATAYPDPEGYVISTLADKYVGTYPDVDHEFQIKGRIAAGSDLDLAVVRRMIELQLRLMREDPTGLWRDPCAVQPDGDREYHVRRNSMDGRENAVMFLVTGNVEILESIWLYVARTKDLDWLRAHIADIEGAASLVEDCVDRQGRLWSDVYYEDQVIKDGRETMAASLAAYGFRLLAELEALIGRDGTGYVALSDKISAALTEPIPAGYWDPANKRFVDWVDRSGKVHDHLHLLGNILPVLFGQASSEQAESVLALVEAERDEFQRFPTFLAARIADYTDSEIGDGGPYDLCAAGRYWCWDAAFWSSRRDGVTLFDQLTTVAAQGRADAWIMGERYDMGHVYYADGTPWHGAAHYYEYPCVYSWVLLHEFLGVRPDLEADLLIAPRLATPGTVTLGQAAYRLRYSFSPGSLTLHNLADVTRTFRVELGGVVQTVTVGADESVTVR